MAVPADFPGLRVWLVADDITLPAGAPVASWTCRKGSGDYTQSVSSKRPTFNIDAELRGSLVFDGVDDCLVFPSGALDVGRGGTTITAIAVYRPDAFADGYEEQEAMVALSVSSSTASPRYELSRATIDGTLRGRMGQGDAIFAFYTFSQGVWQLMPGNTGIVTGQFVYSQGGAELAVDGYVDQYVDLLTPENVPDTDAAAGTIGSTATEGGFFAFGEMRELLILEGDLVSTDRAVLHSYLSATYGIVVADYDPDWDTGGPTPPSGPTELLSPAATVSAGGWTTQAGSTTGLHLVLDEEPADDADYIRRTVT